MSDATASFYELRKLAGEILENAKGNLPKDKRDALTKIVDAESDDSSKTKKRCNQCYEEDCLCCHEDLAEDQHTVRMMIKGHGLSMEMFHTLSTATPTRSILPKPIVPIKPLAPIKPIKPIAKNVYSDLLADFSAVGLSAMEDKKEPEAIVVDVGNKKPKDALKHIEEIRTEMIKAAGPSLGTTSVTLESEDPYRTPGKRPMEDVLREAGIDHEIIVNLQITGGDWTDEQTQLLRDLGDTHKSVNFLSNSGPAISLALNAFGLVEPRPGIWKRSWAALCGAVGRTFTMPPRVDHGHIKVPQENLPPLRDPPRPQLPPSGGNPFATPLSAPLPMFGEEDPRENGVCAQIGTVYTDNLDLRVYVKTGETDRDWSRIYSTAEEMEADA